MNAHTLRTLPAPEERPFLLILAALILFAATALGGAIVLGNAPPVDTPGGGGDGGDGVIGGNGPGLSVPEAMASDLGTPLLVNGHLYVTAGGSVYLAESLAESFPPQIDVTRSLLVRGLDLSTIPELTVASNGVTWTDAYIQLAGEVANGVMTIADSATG